MTQASKCAHASNIFLTTAVLLDRIEQITNLVRLNEYLFLPDAEDVITFPIAEK